MDRQTRKQLKRDPFAQEVGQTFQFVTDHRSEIVKYGSIALAAIVIAGGVYFYNRHESGVRQDALAEAMKIDNASISPTPQPPNVTFATQDEKDKASNKAFMDVSVKYHGTQEGAIAGLYLGGRLAEKGKVAEAEKIFKDVVDSAPKDYASLAKISLAQVYGSEGKMDDAKKLMQDVIDHPTALVSKEQAQIELAQILENSDPAAARKLLEPLRTGRTAISRAAITEMGKIGQSN